MDQCPSLKNTYILQKRTLLGSYKKQTTLNEKLVGLSYHDYNFICNCSRHILVICVLFKIGVKFGLNLRTLYCSGSDEHPYRIFHNKCEFYFTINFGTRLLG